MLDDAQWPAQKWLEIYNKYLTGTDLASTFTWLIEHLWHVLEKQVWPAKDTPHSFEDFCLCLQRFGVHGENWMKNKDQENCFLFFTLQLQNIVIHILPTVTTVWTSYLRHLKP